MVQSISGTDVIVDELDPIKGRGRHLFEAHDVGTQIDISPDGTLFAYALASGPPNSNIPEMTAKTPGNRIDWDGNSRGLYVGDASPSTGARLLHTDFRGNSVLIWRQSGSAQIWGMPSPDGRWLALAGATLDSNAWLVENF